MYSLVVKHFSFQSLALINFSPMGGKKERKKDRARPWVWQLGDEKSLHMRARRQWREVGRSPHWVRT